MSALSINRHSTGAELFDGDNTLDVNAQKERPLLPHNNWEHHRVNRLIGDPDDLSQLALLAPLLAKLSHQGRWIVLVGAPKCNYRALFRQVGIACDNILMVHPKDQLDALWATEQALMSGTNSAVLSWPGEISRRDLRRLQLASKSDKALAFLFQAGNQSVTSSPHRQSRTTHPGTSPPTLHHFH